MSSVTPVQSRIPASSDQEIFNIVEFKGLNCIENPFSASPGSATDSKNIYLNDEGTLATRPRIHFEQTFPAGYNVKKVINVTKINDNKTFYRILNTSDEYVNLLRIDNGSISGEIISDDVGMTNSNDQFSVFLNDEGVLFFSCDNGLYYLDDLTFKNAYGSDKAYIPVTKVGSKINDESVAEDFESPNLLTNKYRTSYYFGLGNNFTSDNFDKDGDFSEVFNSKKITNPELENCNVYQVLTQNARGDCLLLSGNGRDSNHNVTYNGGDPKVGMYYIDTDEYISFENFTIENSSTFYVDSIDDHYGISNDGLFVYSIKFSSLQENNLYKYNVTISESNIQAETIKNVVSNVLYASIDSTKYTIHSSTISATKSWRDNEECFIMMSFGASGQTSEDYQTIRILSYGNKAFSGSSFNVSEFKYFNENTTIEGPSIVVDFYEGVFGTLRDTVVTTSEGSDVECAFDKYILNSENKYIYLGTKQIKAITFPTIYFSYNKLIYCARYYGQNRKNSGFIFDTESNRQYEINLLKLNDDYDDVMIYPLHAGNSCVIYTIKSNSVNIYYGGDITSPDSYPVKVYTTIITYNQNILNQNKRLIVNTISLGGLNQNIKSLFFIPLENGENTIIKTEYNKESSKKPLLYLTSESKESPTTLSYTAHVLFDNKVFLYMGKEENKENRVRGSKDMSAWYGPEKSAIDISDSEPITSMVQVSNSNLAIFKEESALILSETEDIADDYIAVNLKTSLGNIPKKQAIVSSYSNLPMVINENGIQALKQTENVVTGDDIFVSLSDLIAPKLNILKDKQNIKTHNHRYWTYFYYDKYIWVLDNRTLEGYYWELPISIDYMREEVFVADNVDESITMIWSGDKKYSLTTTTYFKENNDDKDLAEDIITYQDYLGDGLFNRIEGRGKTPPLYLNTINYIKKLVSVSLIFADRDRELYYDVVNNKYTVTSDDSVDNLQLLYTFKAYRKKSKFLNSEFSGQMDYVKNLKIKPRLQKFDFVELELTNKRTDSGGNNIGTYEDYMTNNDEPSTYGGKILDKLNLIGIAFRFTVSEGA